MDFVCFVCFVVNLCFLGLLLWKKIKQEVTGEQSCFFL